MPTNPSQAHLLPQVLLRTKSELGSLLDMLPSSLELLSAGSLARQGVELFSNAANARRFISVLTRTQSHLREANVPVLVQHRDAPALIPIEDLSRSQRRWLGQLALELYFTQLFRSEVAVLDLWPSRLGIDASNDAIWSPRPLYLSWDPGFRRGLQNVYAGFFFDAEERFDQGVHALGLGDAAETLLRHFGEGDQRSVRFSTEVLQATLGEISKGRHDEDRPLHPNFMAFGLYLMSLTAVLEALDMRFDVRAAFKRSYPGSFQR